MLPWLLKATAALLIVVFTLFQIPSVQNHFFTNFLQHLSRSTQFTITHQRFHVKWLHRVSLTGLTVRDPQGNDVVAAEQVLLKVSPWQLLQLSLSKSTQHLTTLEVQANDLEIALHDLAGKQFEKKLAVKKLSTRLRLALDRVVCKALKLQTGHSLLQGVCTVTYDDSAGSATLYDRVQITAQLSDSVVAAEELGLFIPYFKEHQAIYRFSGTLEGKLNDLRLKDFQLDWGEQNNHLKGNLSLQGFPKLQEAVFDLDLQQGYIWTKDLHPYLASKGHDLLDGVAFIKPQGRIYGKLDDFVTRATFDTNLGKVKTDLAFQVDPTSQLATYKGMVATYDFELGSWLHNRHVQQVSMQGQIDGKGLSLSTAQFQLAAHIDKLGVHHDVYRNISTEGSFSRTAFQGRIAADDPRLKFQLDTTIDLSNDQGGVTLQGDLEHARLRFLQLTEADVTLRTKLSFVLQGLSLDESQLDAQLSTLCIGFADRQVRLDAVSIHKSQTGGNNLLALTSDLVALKAEGDFSYAHLGTDLHRFVQNMQRRLTDGDFVPSRHTLQSYTLTYQARCNDANPLLRVLMPGAYIAPGAQMQGSFSQGETTNFSLQLTEVDVLAFKQHRWKGTELKLFACQTKDTPAVSATVELASKEQQWGSVSSTKDLALAISWENDHIAFNSVLHSTDAMNELDLQGKAALSDGAMELVLHPNKLRLRGHQWRIHPDNCITLGKSWLSFRDFVLVSDQQQLSLQGIMSADPNQALTLRVDNFSLANLRLLVNRSLTGVLNGAVVLREKEQLQIDGQVALSQVTIDNALVGDIHMQASWDHVLRRLNLSGKVDEAGQQTATIHGFYEPMKGQESLQLTANFDHAKIAPLALLISDELSLQGGTFSGMLGIQGSLSRPRFAGRGKISHGLLGIQYLKTLYHAHADVRFADQAIHLTNLVLTDDQQGEAILQGLLFYKGAEDWQIALEGNMTRFKLLDKSAEDSDYFYGTGILSGGLSLSGTFSNMAIHINSKTEAGTHAYIPLSESTQVSQEGFIRFVDAATKQYDSVSQQAITSLQGVKLTMLLEVTPEASTTLILNDTTGDLIRGRGRGNLNIAVDAEGALSMAGGFEFSEGEYNFSFYRIFNKTFKILPQSKITWTDSPYEGVLDVRTVYERRASLSPLLNPMADVAADEARKKYPVQVLAFLQGALLSPAISFKVNFSEGPSHVALRDSIIDFQRKAQEDNFYLASQVTSLVILGTFSAAQLTDVWSDAVSGSAGEIVTQQLSSILTQLDKNLEVSADLDLDRLNNEGLGSLYLEISRNFLDGRLKVSRKGGIGRYGIGGLDTAQILGDWTVEYLIYRDGSLRAKLYNKQNVGLTYRDIDGVVNPSGGFSVLYTHSFNHWRELFRKGKTSNKQ